MLEAVTLHVRVLALFCTKTGSEPGNLIFSVPWCRSRHAPPWMATTSLADTRLAPLFSL